MAPNQWPADGSLPPHVVEFVEWRLSLDRRPATISAWAEENGVHRMTVHTWLKDPRVIKAMEKRASELNIQVDRTQDMVNAIYKAGVAGDMKAAALYLQYIDRLTPKRVVIQDERIEKLSDEELQAELASLGLIPSED